MFAVFVGWSAFEKSFISAQRVRIAPGVNVSSPKIFGYRLASLIPQIAMCGTFLKRKDSQRTFQNGPRRSLPPKFGDMAGTDLKERAILLICGMHEISNQR